MKPGGLGRPGPPQIERSDVRKLLEERIAGMKRNEEQLSTQRQRLLEALDQNLANLNATKGALQLADDLLKQLPPEPESERPMSLVDLQHALGADSVEVVSADA